jgi:hypothetical protein
MDHAINDKVYKGDTRIMRSTSQIDHAINDQVYQ